MKIKDMAIVAATRVHEVHSDSYVRGYSAGAKAIINMIESLMDRDNWLEAHRISIWRKLQQLKDDQS